MGNSFSWERATVVAEQLRCLLMCSAIESSLDVPFEKHKLKITAFIFRENGLVQFSEVPQTQFCVQQFSTRNSYRPRKPSNSFSIPFAWWCWVNIFAFHIPYEIEPSRWYLQSPTMSNIWLTFQLQISLSSYRNYFRHASSGALSSSWWRR